MINQDQGLKWYQTPNPVGQRVQSFLPMLRRHSKNKCTCMAKIRICMTARLSFIPHFAFNLHCEGGRGGVGPKADNK